MAMKNKWPGRRACIDLFASYGLNRVEDSGELCWGSSLLALHADAGFDTYIFCDKDPRATKVLCERVTDPIYFGLPVFDLDIGSESAGARTSQSAYDCERAGRRTRPPLARLRTAGADGGEGLAASGADCCSNGDRSWPRAGAQRPLFT